VNNHWLLVRADFAFTGGGDRVILKRWRRVLAESLPVLLGRVGKARVRLHGGGSFTAWMRIPVERRPGRNRVRTLAARLREDLQAALSPVRGLVFELAVRRFRRKAAPPRVALPVVDRRLPNATATILPLEGEVRLRQEGVRAQVRQHEGLALYPEPSA
jgi:hypothetical protein